MVHRSGIAVGHVPRTILAVCSMFLLQGDSISCQVTGTRRYSIDLPQGGLELPCRLSFTGPQKVDGKLQKLLDKAPKLPQGTNSSAKEEPPKKKIKLDEAIAPTQKEHSIVPNSTVNAVWMMYQCHTLLLSDKTIIRNGGRLTDRHMTFCQAVLKVQFPATEGLECTLYQSKQREAKIKLGLQVVYLENRAHWVLASNIGCDDSHLNVYDYSSGDKELLNVLTRLFDFKTLTFVDFQKQTGSSDCGLFVIAAACALLFGQNPSTCLFNQSLMRNYLLLCIENCYFNPFPLLTIKNKK